MKTSSVKLNDLLNMFYKKTFDLKHNIFLDIKRNIIFNNIKYKYIRGIKLEANGRLTRRYRADRAIHKRKWKGGLKNVDTAFKGLSTPNFRGYLSPNVEYSLKTSKRRIGAFAVKGWIGGR